MITWDAEEVARFFGARPEKPHGEDTELIFTFDSDGREIRLIVQPYNDYASVVVAGRTGGSPPVELRMDCVSIGPDPTENDDSPPSIILRGSHVADAADTDGVHTSYWIRIKAAGETFAIDSNFVLETARESMAGDGSGGRKRLSGCLLILLVMLMLVAVIALAANLLGAAP